MAVYKSKYTGPQVDALLDKINTLITVDQTIVEDSKNPVAGGAVYTALGNKVDKETGKGLSTNDFTTAEKTKLDSLAEIKTIGTGLDLDDNGELTATGGGSGGTTNYNDLSNKPQINGNTLSGNKTSAQLGLASASDIPTVPITAIQKNGTGITPVSGTVNITVPTQASDINAATATQGDKADTAIQGIKVNSSTVNPDANKVVNITIPTTAADVSALPDTTKYAVALSLTINSSTFVMTGQLKDQNGDNLGTAQTIDLPLESVVVGGSYNSQTKKVVLTLQNGNTIEFSVADLVSGLQTELSASNKLNPAYINYDSTHRAVSDTEKSTWNGKQDALTTAQLAAANSGIDSAKVEQIETNKSNILYAQKTGVKNIMDLSKYKELNPSVVVGDNIVFHGVTWTISNSSGLTVSGASDSSGSYPTIYSATLPIGTYYLSGGDSTIELLTPTSQRESGQGLTIEITESTTQPYIIRGIVPPNTSITGTHNIKPMLRQVGDSTFEPYAMSNAELTAKEQANENNILFNTNTGVKNIIKNTASSSDIFTVNADGTIKAQGTNSDSSVKFITVSIILASDAYKLNGMILNGCPSGGESGGYRINLQLYGGNYTNYAVDRGDGAVISGIPKNLSYNLRLIAVVEARKTVDIVFKPMISIIGGEYQPYAMSNAELTAKEQANENNISTDEAALVEIVDSGAKNLFQISANAYQSDINGLTATYNADGSVTVTGTMADTTKNAIIYISPNRNMDYRKYQGCVLSGGISENERITLQNSVSPYNSIAISRGTGVEITNIIPEKTLLYIYIAKRSTAVNYTFKPMICTKAAWDISHEYQPYRPSYQELTDRTTVYVVDSSLFSYTDTLSEGIHFAKQNAATGTDKPVSGKRYMYQIFVYNSYFATIIAYEGQSSSAPIMYIVNKENGTWGSWFKFEGIAVT